MNDSAMLEPRTPRLPTLFVPHGGGPCFFMDPPPGDPHAWDAMASCLRGIAASVGTKPRAGSSSLAMPAAESSARTRDASTGEPGAG